MTYFDPADSSSWLWEALDYASWQRAGVPAPRTVAYLGGSYFYQWGTSTQILVEDPGRVRHVLSYPEWEASGFQTFDRRHNEGFLKLFLDEHDCPHVRRRPRKRCSHYL